MNINLFFPTPVADDEIESDLEDYVLFLSRSDKGVNKSNSGGWQSKPYSKPENEFAELWNAIEERVNIYHKNMSLKGNVQISSWWFNVNYKGSMNRQHQHPNSIHSGVYYIKSPENCGWIEFTHPSSTLQWGWEGGIIETANEKNSSMVSLKSKKNILYIFPSWAKHGVDVNKSEEERISLSFNTNLI